MGTTTSYLKHIKGITFVGKSKSNHWVNLDGPEDFGGSYAGNSPKELLLLSLAGCTASDVASILTKKRVNFNNFEVNVTAEVMEEHPKVFTKIDLEYVIHGTDVQPKDVERAIELSQSTYCAVTAMLKKAVEINHTYRIEEINNQSVVV
jgi:putative redox protein